MSEAPRNLLVAKLLRAGQPNSPRSATCLRPHQWSLARLKGLATGPNVLDGHVLLLPGIRPEREHFTLTDKES